MMLSARNYKLVKLGLIDINHFNVIVVLVVFLSIKPQCDGYFSRLGTIVYEKGGIMYFLMIVVLAIGFTTGHDYWRHDNYQQGNGGIAGYPGCQCSCEPQPRIRDSGVLSSSRSRRRKKRRRLRESVNGDIIRGSRDIAVDPLPSGGGEIIRQGGVLGGFQGTRDIVDRRSHGIKVSDAIPESPVIMDGVLGGSRGSPLIDRGSRGFAADNVEVNGNQRVIERSTTNRVFPEFTQTNGFDNGFTDNGFDNGFNGNGLNDVNVIGNTAGFETDQNVGIQDRFIGDSFSSIGGIRQGSKGYGRHKSKYERSHKRRRRRRYKY